MTKADAVDEETLELAAELARELVPGSEVVAVSARTGAGIDELRAAIGRTADGVEEERRDGATRLYVDRSFTLRGIGTVVTGTLWSGTVGAGDELALQPSGKHVRVRSVQVHDRDVERAESGQRVAVSLPGVERAEALRGDALVEQGAYPSRTGSTSCSTSSSRFATALAFAFMSGHRTLSLASSERVSAGRSCDWPSPSSPPVATA